MLARFFTFLSGLSLFYKAIGIAVLVAGLWYAKARYDRYQQDIGAEQAKVNLLEQIGWETIEQAQKEREELAVERARLVGEIRDREDRLAALERELKEWSRRQRLSQQAFERRIHELGTEVSGIADADLLPSVYGTLTRLRSRTPLEGDPAPPPPTGGDARPP